MAQKRPRIDGEATQCLICFCPYTTSNEHKACCLKCGHIFGKPCILKWLETNKRCPTCTQSAQKRDIRVIFSPNLTSVDDSKIKRLEKELQDIKFKNILLQNRINTATTTDSKTETDKFYLTPTYQHVVTDAKIFAVNPTSEMLYIVENHPLSPPIILSLSLTETNYSKCFKYHEKNIKDIKFCSIPNNIIATVSLDKTLKLYSTENESMVLQYNTNKQLWSLDWNENNPNYFYCGSSQGDILTFDIRNTNGYVNSIKLSQTLPIHSIKYGKYQNSDSNDNNNNEIGIYTASIHDFSFTNLTTNKSISLFNFNQNNRSLGCTSFDIVDNYCALSIRSNDITSPSYINMYCITPKFKFKSNLTGFTNYLIMSKLHINKESMSILCGCESSKTVFIWDKDGNIVNRTNSHPSPVSAIQSYNDHFITLCSDEIRLYNKKWTENSNSNNNIDDTTTNTITK